MRLSGEGLDIAKNAIIDIELLIVSTNKLRGRGDHQISKINLPPHPKITSQAVEHLSLFSR